LAGKSPVNGGFSGKINYKRGIFQQTMFDYRENSTVLGIVRVFYLNWGSHIGDIERPHG
jgi:hypothetical protein